MASGWSRAASIALQASTPSRSVGVAVAEDARPVEHRAGQGLALPDRRKEHVGIGSPRQVDELVPEVLLERAAPARRPGGELGSDVLGHVADGDGGHTRMLLLVPARCNGPGAMEGDAL